MNVTGSQHYRPSSWLTLTLRAQKRQAHRGKVMLLYSQGHATLVGVSNMGICFLCLVLASLCE